MYLIIYENFIEKGLYCMWNYRKLGETPWRTELRNPNVQLEPGIRLFFEIYGKLGTIIGLSWGLIFAYQTITSAVGRRIQSRAICGRTISRSTWYYGVYNPNKALGESKPPPSTFKFVVQYIELIHHWICLFKGFPSMSSFLSQDK